MKNIGYKKGIVFGIIILFVGASVAPSINGTISKMSGTELNKKTLNQELQSTEQIPNSLLTTGDENPSSLAFHTFDETGEKQQNVVLPKDEADKIIDILEELKYKIVYEPRSEETQELKIVFVDLLDSYDLIPDGLSKEDVLSMLNPSWLNNKQKTTEVRTRTLLLRSFTSRIIEKIVNLQQIFKNRFGITVLKNFDKNTMITPSYADTATATFCSISSGGNGATLPLFLLPRPRGVAVWSASLAVTLVGELLTGKGFTAGGAQSGTALGFMGLGLTYAFPGYTMYGFVGYALYTKVSADFIEFFEPPNYAPIISDENPANGGKDVSLSLSELSFRISDADGDLMDYTVTTEPDIGSGSGNNKNNGVYKVQISGLNENTEYTWHVIVDDEYNTVEKEFTFTTETVAPIISDPTPEDDENYVSPEITQLSFRLSDNQGDLMDYTVNTDPYIGYGSGNNVGNGIYTVDISGLDYTTEYTWTVEATDGTYWAEEVFNFKTLPIMEFDPFDEGWQYRKQITIDHTKVDGNLIDFPILVSTVDSDLRDKAQFDGDDILFMDDVGVANRLYHEIEYYNGNNGELMAWVRIPDLDDNSDTVLYIYYGNPSCGDQQYPELVWDSDFKAVWHICEDGLGKRFDSTFNNNDGIPYNYEGNEAITGVIDGADDFDGSNDHIRTGVSFDYNYRTVSLWFKIDTIPTGDTDCILKQDSDELNYGVIALNLKNDNKLHCAAGGLEGNYAFTIQTETWYMLHLIRDGSQLRYFIDGDLKHTGASSSDGSSWNPNKNFVIAAGRTYDRYFDGIIDEIRVSNTARSDDWISTEYNNQNDPSGFLSFGPEET